MEEFSLFIEEPKEEKEEMGTGTLTRVRKFCSLFTQKGKRERDYF